jgi:excisionase family DNA binding protein
MQRDSRAVHPESLDMLVGAIAGQVAAQVKAELLAQLQHPPQVQAVLLSVKDAAVYLGRSEQSIQHLIFAHELPVVRVGRRVHLDRRDLDLWIEKNKY